MNSRFFFTGFGLNPEYEAGIPKNIENAADQYRNAYRDVAVQKAVGTLGGPTPGLGYNGQENHATAQTNQGLTLGRGNQGGRGGVEVPYNQVDPAYRRPEQGQQEAVGPNNPYYQGKDPAGVYQRYHRLG